MSSDNKYEDFFSGHLVDIEAKALRREMKYFSSAQKPIIQYNDKSLLLFASNSYLGLADHPDILDYAVRAAKQYGTGSGGSRLVSGSSEIHRLLESTLAKFKGYESAIVFSSGFAANTGVLSAIADKNWTIFCDRLNHASIIDGILQSGAKLVVYKHCDMTDLEMHASRLTTKFGMIVSDGVFSMDGDIAPLAEISAIAKKYSLLTMVDDAHGTGVLGIEGKGSCEYCKIADIDINMGTLSKAIPGEGGYICASRTIIDYLVHKARSFVFSTSPSAFSAATAIASIAVIRNEPERRTSLAEKSSFIRNNLQAAGFDVPQGITPIIPVMTYDSGKTSAFSKMLFKKGIFIPGIRPPTVQPGKSRLRLSIMATHSDEQLRFAAETIIQCGKVCGII